MRVIRKNLQGREQVRNVGQRPPHFTTYSNSLSRSDIRPGRSDETRRVKAKLCRFVKRGSIFSSESMNYLYEYMNIQAGVVNISLTSCVVNKGHSTGNPFRKAIHTRPGRCLDTDCASSKLHPRVVLSRTSTGFCPTAETMLS